MRQALINGAVGGFMGYTAGTLAEHGFLLLGLLLFIAWFVGMVNSLISD